MGSSMFLVYARVGLTDETTDFDNPEGALKGIIAASYSLGAIMSLPFVPIVNRKWGRRWAIFSGSMVMVVGAIVQGASQHVGMYIVARMLLGFGIPCCIVAGSSLIGELAYAKERPILTSLFNVSYFIGKYSRLPSDSTKKRRLNKAKKVKLPPLVSAMAPTPFRMTGPGESLLSYRSPLPCCRSDSSSFSLSRLAGSSPRTGPRRRTRSWLNTTLKVTSTRSLSEPKLLRSPPPFRSSQKPQRRTGSISSEPQE